MEFQTFGKTQRKHGESENFKRPNGKKIEAEKMSAVISLKLQMLSCYKGKPELHMENAGNLLSFKCVLV